MVGGERQRRNKTVELAALLAFSLFSCSLNDMVLNQGGGGMRMVDRSWKNISHVMWATNKGK